MCIRDTRTTAQIEASENARKRRRTLENRLADQQRVSDLREYGAQFAPIMVDVDIAANRSGIATTLLLHRAFKA